MKAMVNFTNSLIAFLIIGVIGIAIGITFAVLDLIENSLNGTLTIPTAISNAIDTTASLSGTGLIIAAAVAIITLILGLVVIFTGRRRE